MKATSLSGFKLGTIELVQIPKLQVLLTLHTDMRIILEGPDLVGKSTGVTLLKGILPVEDRLMDFTESIDANNIDYTKLLNAVDSVGETLIVILYIRDDNILLRRLKQRENPDQYDLKCVDYNRQYRKVASFLNDRQNVVSIEVDGLNKYQKTSRIVEEYLRYKDKVGHGEILSNSGK